MHSAGSQLSWRLWADPLKGKAPEAGTERLCARDVLTGFSLRTLSS